MFVNKSIETGIRYKFIIKTFGDVTLNGMCGDVYNNENTVTFTDVRRNDGEQLISTANNQDNIVVLPKHEILCIVEDH